MFVTKEILDQNYILLMQKSGWKNKISLKSINK